MDCKRLNAKLVEKEYWTAVLQKKYLADVWKKYFIVNWWENKLYSVSESKKSYGVCYCISYRPIGMLEWILQRWWWNDRGIWTADGIFNDWII